MTEFAETKLLRAILLPDKCDRYLDFARSTKNRRKFLDALYHFGDFDPSVVANVPSNATSVSVLEELRRRGAGGMSYLISADQDLDKSIHSLESAVDCVFALVDATIICCSNTLAYYEGEAPNNRLILHRR